MLKSDQFLISHHFFMLCQREMSANRSPGEARGRGGGSRWGEVQVRRTKRRMGNNWRSWKSKPMFTITERTNLHYRCITCLLDVITIKLISCYILFKYLHVSFKASISYPFWDFVKAAAELFGSSWWHGRWKRAENLTVPYQGIFLLLLMWLKYLVPQLSGLAPAASVS